jgi:hypothetical protein
MRRGYGTSHLMEAGIFGVYSQHIRALFMNIPLLMGQCMIFAVPFTLVRFGLRDRVTRLACVLLLVALPVYSQRPLLMDLSGILTALAVVAALVSPLWRRPLAVLAATGITSMASFGVVASLQRGGLLRVSAFTRLICVDSGIAIAVVVCLYLHRLLLRPRHDDRLGMMRIAAPTMTNRYGTNPQAHGGSLGDQHGRGSGGAVEDGLHGFVGLGEREGLGDGGEVDLFG